MLPSFAEFEHVILSSGVARAIKMLGKNGIDAAGKPPYQEKNLNNLGYHLLYELNRIQDAIEIFRLNTKFYTTSYNAFDSLGEAYFVNGDVEAAVKAYRDSLQLNPSNRNAREMLRQLFRYCDK